MNYYEFLGVAADSDFAVIKKAYYRRAKECHPDLFGNAPEKAEEFKHLVLVFDTLSDPGKRKHYDDGVFLERRIVFREKTYADVSIMDTGADDTLEELIVGNEPPTDTRLTTLFRDLERTVVFMTCREAKNYYAAGRYLIAARLFSTLVGMAPGNILYRIYLARTLVKTRDYRGAKRHYKAAILLGSRRVPVQKLPAVHAELEELSRKQMPLFHKLKRFFAPEKEAILKMPDELMIEETARLMSKMVDNDGKQKKRLK